MNDRELLSSTLERIGNGVDAIRDTVGGTTIEEVANNVKKVRRVNSIAERDSIANPNDGDMCIVYDTTNSEVIPWVFADSQGTNSTESNVLVFEKSVTLTQEEYDLVLEKEENGLVWNVVFPEGIDVGEHNKFSIVDTSSSFGATFSVSVGGYIFNVTYTGDSETLTLTRDEYSLYDGVKNVSLSNDLDTIILPFSMTIQGSESAAELHPEIASKFIHTVRLYTWEVPTRSNLLSLPERGFTKSSPYSVEQRYSIQRTKDNQEVGFINIDTSDNTIYVDNPSGNITYQFESGVGYVSQGGSSGSTASYLFTDYVKIYVSGSGDFVVSDFIKTCKRNIPVIYIYSHNNWELVNEDTNWYQC